MTNVPEEEAMGELVPFPDRAPANVVLDGEIVTDDEYLRLTTQRAQALARWRGYRDNAVVAVSTVRTAASHHRTRNAAKAVFRHVLYVPVGGLVVARRLWEAKTNSLYQRMIRAAEATGDHDRLLEWEQRGEQARERRHKRRMETLRMPFVLAKALAMGGITLVGLLLALGVVLAAADKDAGQILAPIAALLDAARWTVWAFAVIWGPLVLVAPWLVVLVLWQIGRTSGATPTWVMPANQRTTEGELITPSSVVTALRDLGISSLRTAIVEMGDAGAGMLGPIRIAGCGVEVDVTLPRGTSTEDVQKRRRKLAENLGRHEHELHITIPQAARTVRLWIADPGALDEPIGPSPLVTDPDITADLYAGRAPWGQDLRGDAVAISLLQRHLLITGLSNQGKTAALRALALWLLFDPSCEFRIADLKGVGDWRMFDGAATVLIQGPTDDHVIAATEMLEASVAEMEQRIARLEASGATDGVTREMARKRGSGFHPIFLVIDEAQVAFMCPAAGPDKRPYGGTKATSRYFMAARKLHNQGRAVNVVLWEGTQDPTDQNLPKLVREGAHIRASLVVGTEEQARMALGDKAINGGAAPHKLRQGLDKGTLVVAGDGVPLPNGQAALTVRTHFVDGAEAAEIADRAKARRGPQSTATDTEPGRDLLDDVRTVLGGIDRMRSAEVLRSLSERWPDTYGSWSAQRFAAALAEAGMAIRQGRVDGEAGQRYIAADDVLDALDNRAEQTAHPRTNC
jgi:S-DNA-T family DNA segregation ATPase FtsK/SpoIIIE